MTLDATHKMRLSVFTSNKLESRAEDVKGADEHVEETQQQGQLHH